jgi:hypothetical protein
MILQVFGLATLITGIEEADAASGLYSIHFQSE